MSTTQYVKSHTHWSEMQENSVEYTALPRFSRQTPL